MVQTIEPIVSASKQNKPKTKRPLPSISLQSNQPSFTLQSQKRRKIQQPTTNNSPPTAMEYDTASDISFIDSDSLFDSMSEESQSPAKQLTAHNSQVQSITNITSTIVPNIAQVQANQPPSLPLALLASTNLQTTIQSMHGQQAHIDHSLHFPLLSNMNDVSQLFNSSPSFVQENICQNPLVLHTSIQPILSENPFLSQFPQLPNSLPIQLSIPPTSLEHGPHITPSQPQTNNNFISGIDNGIFSKLLNLPPTLGNPFLQTFLPKEIPNILPSPLQFNNSNTQGYQPHLSMIPMNASPSLQSNNRLMRTLFHSSRLHLIRSQHHKYLVHRSAFSPQKTLLIQ